MSDKIKVKILPWDELLKKGDELISCGIVGPDGKAGFAYSMESSLPKNRIIEVEKVHDGEYKWQVNDIRCWIICDWMIDKKKSKLKTAGLIIGTAVMPGGIFIAGGYLAYKKLRGKL